MSWKWLGIIAVIVPGLVVWARPSARSAVPESALRDRIVSTLRARYGLESSVQLTPGPLESSQDAAFYECVVNIENGAKKSSQPVSIAKDGRYLAMSPLLYLGPNTSAEVVRNVRVFFKLGPEWQLSDGPLERSPVPGFYETQVAAEKAGKKQTVTFYVSEDKRYVSLGEVYYLRPPASVEKLINTRNQPCSGPVSAPVTIVEYADLECPSCARLQPFLENELLPRYSGKVRVVYKDFPLPMHDWSRKAAVANECAYQIDPSAFVRYRSSIFAHQTEINVTNVREQLLSLGEAAGISRLRLAACMDSNASLGRVEADMHEGDELQVTMTPTCFINGRLLAGFQSPDAYYKVIDGCLERNK